MGQKCCVDSWNAVRFPVLMSNADVSREKALADVLKKSTVIERGGEKIGLIGLTPEDTHEDLLAGREHHVFRTCRRGAGLRLIV